MLRSTLLFFALTGCVHDDALRQPAAQVGGVDDAAADWSGFTVEAAPPTGEPAPVSGLWASLGATLIEDACDVDSLLDDRLDQGLATFLPRAFAVAGSDGQFEILAPGVGGDGPVLCTLDGPQFVCAPQQLGPVTDGQAGTGWSVSLELAGEVMDPGWIEATAVLSLYSAGDAAGLDLGGLGDAPPVCSKVLDLDLELLRDLDPDQVDRPSVDRRPPPT